MKEQSDWYKFNNPEKIDTPALLIYPERVINNINLLKKIVSSTALLRPHVKTHKSARVSRLLIDAGITKFKCATIAEAEMLGRCKAADVLLAYQPTQVKLQRLIQLITAYPKTKYSCLVDNEATASIISVAAIVNKLVIPIYIDLNVGMDRTGITPEKALTLFNYLTTLKGIDFKGLHAYDGHIGDINLAERINHCDREFESVEKLRKNIQELGYPFPLLIAGGSPTFAIHAKRANTECSPGTFVFWDKGYHDHIPEQSFLFAAIVLARVVSLPDETKICIDLGYKSIACEKPLQNRLYFLNAPHLKPVSQSEEHLVIEVLPGHQYKIGDDFFVVPMHICPTVAMYDEAHIIEKGTYAETWAIDARGRTLKPENIKRI
jgi:D-serine deaminase-like pyridoxal phosphate-dependent protein